MHLFITEPSSERCDVTADRLPIDETFRTAIESIKAVQPDFLSDVTKPKDGVIAYQIERTEGSSRQIIYLEGKEPGAPDPTLPFTRLFGSVTVHPPVRTRVYPQDKP